MLILIVHQSVMTIVEHANSVLTFFILPTPSRPFSIAQSSEYWFMLKGRAMIHQNHISYSTTEYRVRWLWGHNGHKQIIVFYSRLLLWWIYHPHCSVQGVGVRVNHSVIASSFIHKLYSYYYWSLTSNEQLQHDHYMVSHSDMFGTG